jgi:hypothetical protein
VASQNGNRKCFAVVWLPSPGATGGGVLECISILH